MALKFKILDERNDKTVVDVNEFKFYEAEVRTLRVQVIEEYDRMPYYLGSGATISFTLPGSPTDITKSGTISSDNRSIITVSLSGTDTTNMVSGNLIATISEVGGVVRAVKSTNVLKKESKLAK